MNRREMDCSERITYILDPASPYSGDDVAALLACDDPALLEVLYGAACSAEYGRHRRVRALLSLRVCLHLLDLMAATTGHEEATAGLLQLMISAKRDARLATPAGALLPTLFPDRRAAEPLFTLLYREDTSISWVAAQALALIDDAAVAAWLHRQLDAGGPVQRAKAALALAWRRDTGVLPALLAALGDDDWLVRELACHGLRVLADVRAVAALSRTVLAEEEPLVRAAAAEALGEIGGEDAVGPLIRALRDADAAVRAAAARGLGVLQSSQAVAPVVGLLQADPSMTVRCSAIQALREMASGVEAIMAALQDASPQVRKAAADALEDFADPRSFAPLITALDDPDLQVRKAAAGTLGEIPAFDSDDPAVVAKIRRLLA